MATRCRETTRVLVETRGRARLTTYQEMITDEQRQAYEREGWFVLEGVLEDAELADLRGECQRFIDKRDAEMDAAGSDHIDLCMRGRRYFVNDCSTESRVLRRFVLGKRMANICRLTLGPDAYLFNDQHVVAQRPSMAGAQPTYPRRKPAKRA